MNILQMSESLQMGIHHLLGAILNTVRFTYSSQYTLRGRYYHECHLQ